mgnify:FL=1
MPAARVAGDVMLVRASEDQLAAVERLQQAAYARNRALLGLEPLPLQADYAAILRDNEVWVKLGIDVGTLEAVLILETDRDHAESDDILIWSIASAPSAQQGGLGRALLACAETRARALGRSMIRLYTGQPLTHLIDWYARNGYEVEHTEILPDRTIVHMLKTLA